MNEEIVESNSKIESKIKQNVWVYSQVIHLWQLTSDLESNKTSDVFKRQ